MIEAVVVKDSINDYGNRLSTFKLRFPKFILAEFNTHRIFSRNASSSRAIPTKKLIDEVRSCEHRVTPVNWGSNKSGMQAGEELIGDQLHLAKQAWLHAACDAAYHAEILLKRGVHKQIVNRVIEPFMFVNVIVSSTEYYNFFGLRLDHAAQPEMRALAEVMWRVFNESTPLRLGHGQWHLPFIEDEDLQEIRRMYDPPIIGEFKDPDRTTQIAIKVSVARCARVSYESHETGKRSTVEADVKLHDFLLTSRELSPFEHQATPDERVGITPFFEEWDTIWDRPQEHGNFCGWRQRRKQLPDEAIAPLPEEYRT